MIPSRPLSVLVVDDEPLARRRLIRMLGTIPGLELAGEAGTVDQALVACRTLGPDILLLDINMPGGDGFTVLEQLGDAAPATVMVTAFDQHAVRAFDQDVVDFVTKPVEPARLSKAIARAIQARETQHIRSLASSVQALRQAVRLSSLPNALLWVKDRNGLRRIAIADITYLEADRDYVKIHTLNGPPCHHAESMAAMERRLIPFGFLRVHRSALVQQTAVIGVLRHRSGSLSLQLVDGTTVPVGRTYHPLVRQQFRSAESPADP
jgi:two-component system, LytTR family, response regulator